MPALSEIPLQTRRRFGSLSDVRWFVTTCFAIFVLPASQAQDQERKLVDRLLRPDTTLQNNAQGKKFATRGALIEKRGTVGTFYLQPRPNEKRFSGTRDFSARAFTSGPFQGGNRTSSASGKQVANLQTAYPTSSGPELRNVQDSQKTIGARSFADERRSFLDHGKSQKSLERQNPPLTIEQVRELLNKNR